MRTNRENCDLTQKKKGGRAGGREQYRKGHCTALIYSAAQIYLTGCEITHFLLLRLGDLLTGRGFTITITQLLEVEVRLGE